MKKRGRKKIVKEILAPEDHDFIGIPFTMPIQRAAKILKNAVNKAGKEGRKWGSEDWGNKGKIIIISPVDPQEQQARPQTPMFAIVGGMPGLGEMPEGMADKLNEIKWNNLVHSIEDIAKARGKNLAKEIPHVVKEHIKSESVSSEQIRELADLCEKFGPTHNCGAGECTLKESSEIVKVVLQTHLKENLQ